MNIDEFRCFACGNVVKWSHVIPHYFKHVHVQKMGGNSTPAQPRVKQ